MSHFRYPQNGQNQSNYAILAVSKMSGTQNKNLRPPFKTNYPSQVTLGTFFVRVRSNFGAILSSLMVLKPSARRQLIWTEFMFSVLSLNLPEETEEFHRSHLNLPPHCRHLVLCTSLRKNKIFCATAVKPKTRKRSVME